MFDFEQAARRGSGSGGGREEEGEVQTPLKASAQHRSRMKAFFSLQPSDTRKERKKRRKSYGSFCNPHPGGGETQGTRSLGRLHRTIAPTDSKTLMSTGQNLSVPRTAGAG